MKKIEDLRSIEKEIKKFYGWTIYFMVFSVVLFGIGIWKMSTDNNLFALVATLMVMLCFLVLSVIELRYWSTKYYIKKYLKEIKEINGK